MTDEELSKFFDTMSVEQLREAYGQQAHAVQTGVKYLMDWDRNHATPEPGHSPKHLRTGVNLALVNNSALASLLIHKGVITELEFWQSLCLETAKEVSRYEAELATKLGAKVKLV